MKAKDFEKILQKTVPYVDVVMLDEPRTVCQCNLEWVYSGGSTYKKYTKICHNPCYLDDVEEEKVQNPDLKDCSAMDEDGDCTVGKFKS